MVEPTGVAGAAGLKNFTDHALAAVLVICTSRITGWPTLSYTLSEFFFE